MKLVDICKILLAGLCCVIQLGCNEAVTTVRSIHKYIPPLYSDIKILPQDTIHFPLSDNTYNEIKSFNYFIHAGKEYISFYDGRSSSIIVYDFLSHERVKKIKLKRLIRNEELHKTSVYIKNLDSIFVTNQKTIYLFDSSGKRKENMPFEDRTDQYAFFDNPQPPVIKNNSLFAGVRPYVKATSFKDLRRWRIIYQFDMPNASKELYYYLPDLYRKNLYGYNFLEYSYCYNNKGNFVFSFPADTNIYETNLADYHISYYGKSRFQNGDIKPVPEESLKKGEAYRSFRLRDSYGPIYFDPITKRYLRLARQKISEAELALKSGTRKQSIIIFNEQFKIIGECPVSNLSSNSLFFTGNGNMYARVNPQDEYALNFVHLVYDEQSQDKHLTKK